ncbi:Mechanosensitive ion channel protein 10 [Sesamum angolense]|uniref:Mechanosensitive ion channel protein 10 n=1 Tax=Sesamum angolense TaxID=2727404 RepID=A0AAE1WXC2_9LAMI|nr:Mechanosensitive ion channel protein 10 [Sesamum angolense]
MLKEEVELILPMIDVAETGQIDRKALTDWVLCDRSGSSNAKVLVSGSTGIATTKVLVFLSSQLVLAVFMFGNTCKTIFEAIIFVFVMHPFDVGDRCVVDGVQVIVEEMNILTTVFLKSDNEKVYYPNAVLATKPISNFYRSPDMGDSLDFCIDFKTPMEKIGALKEKIKKYLEKTPQHWHPNHNLVVKEIENVNKIKMTLFFNHTMNFQDYPEKSRRKTDLVLEMKKIFEELNIRYDLLPQEVHLMDSQIPTAETRK